MRTRSMAPGAARWPPLIWAPSKAGPVGLRRGKQPALVAQDDLGVRADVDDERHAVRQMRLLGQDDPGRIGADMAGDARQHVDACAGMGAETELGRRSC